MYRLTVTKMLLPKNWSLFGSFSWISLQTTLFAKPFVHLLVKIPTQTHHLTAFSPLQVQLDISVTTWCIYLQLCYQVHASALRSLSLEVTVWHSDTLKENAFLGGAMINLAEQLFADSADARPPRLEKTFILLPKLPSLQI